MGNSSAPATRPRRRRPVLRAAFPLLAVVAIAVVVFRSKWPPAIRAVRRMNRAVLNPAMLRLAGREHWYASVVHHVGRRSGTAYATPVLAEPAGDRIYIPLPYGTDVDWCANVLAAGGCVVDREGEHFTTTAPVIVPASDAAGAVDPLRRRALALVGVTDYLRLDVAGRAQ